MIKAIIFDLDNTLYNYDELNEKAIDYAGKWLCRETGILYNQFEEAFMQGRILTKKDTGNCASQHNRIIYFQKMSEKLGFNPIRYSLELYEKYWGYMLNNMQLEKNASRLLKRLRNSDVKIAICTDLTTHIQHRKLKKLGIADYVDVFVSSEEAGVEKPDIKIFNMVLDKLKIHPYEALYVGDSYDKDIIGAADAGIYPVWYNPRKKFRKKEGNLEILEITEMNQLERYIYEN